MSEDGVTNPIKPIVNYTEDDSVDSPKVGKMDTSRSDVNTPSETHKRQEDESTMDTSRMDANTSTVTGDAQPEEDETNDMSKTSSVKDKDKDGNKTTDTSKSDANTSIATAEAEAEEQDKTTDASKSDENNNKGSVGHEESCDDAKVEDKQEAHIAQEAKTVEGEIHAVQELTEENGSLNIQNNDINDEGNISKQITVVVAEVHAVQNLMHENEDANDESQDTNSKIIGLIKSEDGDLNVQHGILTSNDNTNKTQSTDQMEQKTDEDVTIDPVGIDGPSIDIENVNTHEGMNSSGKIQTIKLSIEQLGASHETDGTVESIDITRAGNIVPYYGSTDASMNTSTVTDKGQEENYTVDNKPDESIEFTEVMDLPESESIETVQDEGIMTEEGKII